MESRNPNGSPWNNELTLYPSISSVVWCGVAWHVVWCGVECGTLHFWSWSAAQKIHQINSQSGAVASLLSTPQEDDRLSTQSSNNFETIVIVPHMVSYLQNLQAVEKNNSERPATTSRDGCVIPTCVWLCLVSTAICKPILEPHQPAICSRLLESVHSTKIEDPLPIVWWLQSVLVLFHSALDGGCCGVQCLCWCGVFRNGKGDAEKCECNKHTWVPTCMFTATASNGVSKMA